MVFGSASLWFGVYLVFGVAAVVQAALMALQTWEHRRFSRSRMREVHRYRAKGRARIFAPCKGLDAGLEENLRALLEQDYENYDVVFIVEDAADPAAKIIGKLVIDYPRRASLLVAGRATDCGQKVHNLRVATRRLPAELAYVVFVDSDARPRPEWLNSLIVRLNEPGTGAATGYRWFLPLRATWANHVLYSLNCAVALLLGRGKRHLVWGGSWAMRRELFERLAIRDAWQGTLSDDLVATRVLARHGLAVRFQPPCMVASPLDNNAGGMLDFLRRQYLVVRFHSPGYWLLAVVAATVGSGTLLAGIGWSLAALATGSVPVWPPLALLAVQYGLGAFRAAVRQDLIRTYFPQHQAALAAARRFDIWAGPLVLLINAAALLGSVFGREIHWRGNRYRIFLGGQIEVVDSHPAAESTAAVVPLETPRKKAG